jgi:hypothetical protein
VNALAQLGGLGAHRVALAADLLRPRAELGVPFTFRRQRGAIGQTRPRHATPLLHRTRAQ